jgi:hypothetical protein
MTTKSHFSITELAEQLDEALVAYNQADERSVAACHSKEDQAPHDAEMLRLAKLERALRRIICSTRARGRDEAVLQAIVAVQMVALVAEGTAPKKNCVRARDALLSAISVLIDQPERTPIGEVLRRQYFDTPAKRSKIAGGAK